MELSVSRTRVEAGISQSLRSPSFRAMGTSRKTAPRSSAFCAQAVAPKLPSWRISVVGGSPSPVMKYTGTCFAAK